MQPLPLRPTAPVLYEAKDNYVSFWWGVENLACSSQRRLQTQVNVALKAAGVEAPPTEDEHHNSPLLGREGSSSFYYRKADALGPKLQDFSRRVYPEQIEDHPLLPSLVHQQLSNLAECYDQIHFEEHEAKETVAIKALELEPIVRVLKMPDSTSGGGAAHQRGPEGENQQQAQDKSSQGDAQKKESTGSKLRASTVETANEKVDRYGYIVEAAFINNYGASKHIELEPDGTRKEQQGEGGGDQSKQRSKSPVKFGDLRSTERPIVQGFSPFIEVARLPAGHRFARFHLAGGLSVDDVYFRVRSYVKSNSHQVPEEKFFEFMPEEFRQSVDQLVSPASMVVRWQRPLGPAPVKNLKIEYSEKEKCARITWNHPSVTMDWGNDEPLHLLHSSLGAKNLRSKGAGGNRKQQLGAMRRRSSTLRRPTSASHAKDRRNILPTSPSPTSMMRTPTPSSPRSVGGSTQRPQSARSNNRAGTPSQSYQQIPSSTPQLFSSTSTPTQHFSSSPAFDEPPAEVIDSKTKQIMRDPDSQFCNQLRFEVEYADHCSVFVREKFCLLDNLLPQKLYAIRVRALSSFGYSQWSSVKPLFVQSHEWLLKGDQNVIRVSSSSSNPQENRHVEEDEEAKEMLKAHEKSVVAEEEKKKLQDTWSEAKKASYDWQDNTAWRWPFPCSIVHDSYPTPGETQFHFHPEVAERRKRKEYTMQAITIHPIGTASAGHGHTQDEDVDSNDSRELEEIMEAQQAATAAASKPRKPSPAVRRGSRSPGGSGAVSPAGSSQMQNNSGNTTPTELGAGGASVTSGGTGGVQLIGPTRLIEKIKRIDVPLRRPAQTIDSIMDEFHADTLAESKLGGGGARLDRRVSGTPSETTSEPFASSYHSVGNNNIAAGVMGVARRMSGSFEAPGTLASAASLAAAGTNGNNNNNTKVVHFDKLPPTEMKGRGELGFQSSPFAATKGGGSSSPFGGRAAALNTIGDFISSISPQLLPSALPNALTPTVGLSDGEDPQMFSPSPPAPLPVLADTGSSDDDDEDLAIFSEERMVAASRKRRARNSPPSRRTSPESRPGPPLEVKHTPTKPPSGGSTFATDKFNGGLSSVKKSGSIRFRASPRKLGEATSPVVADDKSHGGQSHHSSQAPQPEALSIPGLKNIRPDALFDFAGQSSGMKKNKGIAAKSSLTGKKLSPRARAEAYEAERRRAYQRLERQEQARFANTKYQYQAVESADLDGDVVISGSRRENSSSASPSPHRLSTVAGGSRRPSSHFRK